MKKKKSQTGASMVETALLVSLVAVTAITSIQAFTQQVGQKFCDVGHAVGRSSDNQANNSLAGTATFIPGSVGGCQYTAVTGIGDQGGGTTLE